MMDRDCRCTFKSQKNPIKFKTSTLENPPILQHNPHKLNHPKKTQPNFLLIHIFLISDHIKKCKIKILAISFNNLINNTYIFHFNSSMQNRSNKLLFWIALHIPKYLIKPKIQIFPLFILFACIFILICLLAHECTFYHHYVFTLFIFVYVDIAEICIIQILDVFY